MNYEEVIVKIQLNIRLLNARPIDYRPLSVLQSRDVLVALAPSVVVSYSSCSSPQLDQVQESARPQKNYRRTIHGKGGECSFCWQTLEPEGRSLPLSIAFML
ncbi:hypothetical protein AVEN_270721-1 [Araneus ventricosus]|uniref:Uncharacterized protein n=1 Tax=Araneus ventricosus TaxID=182803 RepID=A0A4Y2JP03_ARAVE|nr:hypothetical protein AVEN_270721-1 [Araneus ventricosus]